MDAVGWLVGLKTKFKTSF